MTQGLEVGQKAQGGGDKSLNGNAAVSHKEKSDLFTLALVGAPNCGKTTLFNGLTGGRAKVANYPGVTVEMRRGTFEVQDQTISLVDLPGIYGLSARSADARVAVNVVKGEAADFVAPDGLLLVVDATQLRTHLQTVLQMRQLGLPMIVVLNMMDLATRDGVQIDVLGLERQLGVPVVPAYATRAKGRAALLERLETLIAGTVATPEVGTLGLRDLQKQARALATDVILLEPELNTTTRMLDRILLHPFFGGLILASILFFMFQAVFSWAVLPMGVIEAGVEALSGWLNGFLPDIWVRSLMVEGVIAGVGSVVIFLPQIIILFVFILALEMSGYMPRAAFLMDELMLRVGLNGRAFIPLLSSFACAIPGMMAARTLESERDRLTTIMIAPLMTCSARLPVYTVLIAAFIPPKAVLGLFNLQGIVMFGLYLAGIISAITVAFVLRKTLTRGRTQPLIMELPTYKWPEPKELLLGLWQRVKIFLRRAGTMIFTVSVVLWFLVSYPSNVLRDSFAGKIGSFLEPIFAPIGFNLEIVIALVPGMAAREVAVGALGTVYAVEGGGENALGLAETLQNAWSLPTALAFLAWYVFAPQCLATLAVARRETNSRGWTAFMLFYLFALAYAAAGLTYWVTSAIIG